MIGVVMMAVAVMMAMAVTMIVVVIDVGQQGEAGLFYATVPDTSPQFLPPIRRALADLQVG